LAIQKLKKLWRNEYFQTAITVALILIIVFGLYFGAQVALGTEYPLLAVSSESMFPTLNIGDLIIVQKIDPRDINADPINGDILVYKSGDNLIVHRAIGKRYENGEWYITTRGDAYHGSSGEEWSSKQLVGKVIARIPAIGNLPLLLQYDQNIYILFLAIIVILIILMLPFGSKDEKTVTEKEKQTAEKKLFSKIELNLIFYIVINIVLVGFIIFSLWGSFTFWQPGAGTRKPPEGRWVTILGMFSDMQFHRGLAESDVYLSQGFLTYQINYEVSGGIRQGVPTFSWFQFFIIILIVYNVWKLYNFLKAYRERKQKEKSVNV
jgi:signal peptidase